MNDCSLGSGRVGRSFIMIQRRERKEVRERIQCNFRAIECLKCEEFNHNERVLQSKVIGLGELLLSPLNKGGRGHVICD